MMLSSIFMEAVNDPGTTSMDGKGYKARMNSSRHRDSEGKNI